MRYYKLYVKYWMYFQFTKLLKFFDYYYYRYFERRDFTILDKINSNFECADSLFYISLICKWLSNHTKYKQEELIDYPKLPEVFISDKTGNCNDFAYCVLSFIERYKPYMKASLMVIHAPNWEGHSICLIEAKEGYNFTTNDLLYPRYQATVNDVATTVKDTWDHYLLLDENFTIKKLVMR